MEILEIVVGISIAKQSRAYTLNCNKRFFAKLGISDILNSTMGSESQQESMDCNCVIVVKCAT